MNKNIYCILLVFLLFSCKEDDSDRISQPTDTQRNFLMGFTTWPYGSSISDIDSTYTLIHLNGDCITEHLDNKIPWNSFINNTSLPVEFLNDLADRKSRRLPDKPLILSVSLLNGARENLLEDYNGNIPIYQKLNDSTIENAYTLYLEYLLKELQPSYLIAALEVNELMEKDPIKWQEYKLLIAAVKIRIKSNHPTLPISESITLHNWYKPNTNILTAEQQEIASYISTQDYASISFYPFLAGLTSQAEFEEAFTFLNKEVAIPIAFSETGHLAEELIIPSLNISIKSNTQQQDQFMQSLLKSAEKNNYTFVTWWTYRDYDKLWNTFPPNIKDLGQIWRDTGIEDENGKKRPAYFSWQSFYKRS